MSQQSFPSHAPTYDQDQDLQVQCQGVIKKLFPAKRYGFVVLECAEHNGEAHFNYSDLDIPEHERSGLCIGWRLNFGVVHQERPTHHCLFRAIKVRPVSVMVVQCELIDVQVGLLSFQSRELGGKILHCYPNVFNGKFEGPAAKETCRAAVTWNELKLPVSMASHCSQDIPHTRDPREGQPQSRAMYRTPDRKIRKEPVSPITFKPSVHPCHTNGPQNRIILPSGSHYPQSNPSKKQPELKRLDRVTSDRFDGEQRHEDSGLSTSPDVLNTTVSPVPNMTTSTPKTRLSIWTNGKIDCINEIHDVSPLETYPKYTDRIEDVPQSIWTPTGVPPSKEHERFDQQRRHFDRNASFGTHGSIRQPLESTAPSESALTISSLDNRFFMNHSKPLSPVRERNDFGNYSTDGTVLHGNAYTSMLRTEANRPSSLYSPLGLSSEANTSLERAFHHQDTQLNPCLLNFDRHSSLPATFHFLDSMHHVK